MLRGLDFTGTERVAECMETNGRDRGSGIEVRVGERAGHGVRKREEEVGNGSLISSKEKRTGFGGGYGRSPRERTNLLGGGTGSQQGMKLLLRRMI